VWSLRQGTCSFILISLHVWWSPTSATSQHLQLTSAKSFAFSWTFVFNMMSNIPSCLHIMKCICQC
jgi:hypothetical protein